MSIDPQQVFKIRRKAVTVDGMVRQRPLEPNQTVPWLIEPALSGIDFFSWASAHRQELETKVLEHGAILFRGFAIDSVEAFERAIGALSTGALEYQFRASPRTRVGGNIYTSTDYPADQAIFPHNEHSYSPRFPLRLFFYCQEPSITGGETPIGSTREVTQRICPNIREKFREKKIQYVRNYGDGFGLPWQSVFQTQSRVEVEAYCASVGISVQWKAGNRLRTTQVGPAFVYHPSTGEEIWFNHATFFHVSTLPATVKNSLCQSFSPLDLPTNTFYGDGTAIESEVLHELRQAYRSTLVKFPWQRGDLLFIDNILCVHAREPFSGSRTILAGMAQAHLATELQRASV